MPSIKGNTNYNNGIVKAGIKGQGQKITGQIPSNDTTINSEVSTDTQLINASVNPETNFVQTSVRSSGNIVRTDVQSFGNATTTKKGIARIATLDEVIEGEDNSTIVTPYTLKNSVVNDKHYTHEQITPSNTWIVHHNLNKKPSITVVDSADNVVTGDYEFDTLDTATLRFNGAFSGKAYFN